MQNNIELFLENNINDELMLQEFYGLVPSGLSTYGTMMKLPIYSNTRIEDKIIEMIEKYSLGSAQYRAKLINLIREKIIVIGYTEKIGFLKYFFKKIFLSKHSYDRGIPEEFQNTYGVFSKATNTIFVLLDGRISLFGGSYESRFGETHLLKIINHEYIHYSAHMDPEKFFGKYSKLMITYYENLFHAFANSELYHTIGKAQLIEKMKKIDYKLLTKELFFKSEIVSPKRTQLEIIINVFDIIVSHINNDEVAVKILMLPLYFTGMIQNASQERIRKVLKEYPTERKTLARLHGNFNAAYKETFNLHEVYKYSTMFQEMLFPSEIIAIINTIKTSAIS